MLMIIVYRSSFSRKSAICTISMLSSLPDVFSRSLNFLNESIPSTIDFGKCGNFEIYAFINWGENEKKVFTLNKKGLRL